MTTRNAEYFRKWYHNMTPEEKKEHNRARYLRYKKRYNTNSKKWYKKNPMASKAATHNARVLRQYPEACTESSPSNVELRKWLEKSSEEPLCAWCGSKEPSHIDHIIPLSRGGKHEFSNLRILCKICNEAKLDRTDEEFFAWVKAIRHLGEPSL